jgi:hypothetical protein
MTLAANTNQTFNLPIGQVFKLACPIGTTGFVVRLADSPGGEPFAPIAIAGADLSFGPYLTATRWQVVVDAGTVTDSMAKYDPTTSNVLVVSNAGAAVSAALATLAVDPTGANNSLTYTAVAYGAAGNGISIAYVDPGANNATLGIVIVDKAITVNLATGVAGAITSTGTTVAAAIAANPASAALVTVANTGADSGAGVVTAMVAASLTGGVGTAIGVVPPGGMCVDSTNGIVYRNSGTQAVPVWTKQVGQATNMMIVAGGAAGDLTATGIKTTDTLVSVIVMVGAGTAITDITDLTSQFSIKANDKINNTSGTATSSNKLLVTYQR